MIIKQSIITLVKQLIKKFDKAIWKILTGLRFFSTAAAAATNKFHAHRSIVLQWKYWRYRSNIL